MKLSRFNSVLMVALFLSGYAALSYEMSWVRRLVSLFGVTYFSITTILTVFMGGIALGAMVAGRLVDRWRIAPLVALAALEGFLALYAQLFPHFLEVIEGGYLALATGNDLSLFSHAVLRFLFGTLILLPPALASGATLPAAAKAFVHQEQRLGLDVATLYGANVVGACLGCALTTFFTIGLLGYPGTAWLGTSANLGAALLALLLHRQTGAPAVAPDKPARPRQTWKPGAVIIGSAYFSVGFVMLGAELMWTRIFSQFGFNPSTYMFGLILTSFLVGHAAGSGLLFPVLIRFIDAGRLFWGMQLSIGLLTAASVLALTMQPSSLEPVQLLRHVGLVLPLEKAWLLLPGIIGPAALSGALFPLASHLSGKGILNVGTVVGSLSALATVGGIAGSFLTGFFLLPWLGAVHCLILLAGLVILAAVWSRLALTSGGKVSPRIQAALFSLATAAGVYLLLLLVPAHAHLLLFPEETLVRFEEGRSSAAAALVHPKGGRMMLVNGERLTGGGTNVHLAMAIHPQAREAAVIGFGTGTVVLDALEIDQMRKVTAVDIDGNLPLFLPLHLGEKSRLFVPPRFRFVENDGRHFLHTTDQRFDLIINDAAMYAWYLELSTLEFNRLVASRLKPQGLYVGRLHLFRITEDAYRRELATFQAAFPNCSFWLLSNDIGMLVGRNGDQPLTTEDFHKNKDIPGTPRLKYDRHQMELIAAGVELITDAYPLHIPDTFLLHDIYPIIEYIPFHMLPPYGDASSGE